MAFVVPDESAEPILLTLPEFKRLIGGAPSEATDADLLLYLHATDELVAEVVGPLTGTIPARWRAAARLIAVHLWDRWQGAVPVPYQAGTDETTPTFREAIPPDALDMLQLKLAPAAGPQYAFPDAAPWPCS